MVRIYEIIVIVINFWQIFLYSYLLYQPNKIRNSLKSSEFEINYCDLKKKQVFPSYEPSNGRNSLELCEFLR